MKNLLKSAFVGAALLASGSVFASNMGFKLVYPITTATAGVHDGTNIVAIPYFNSFPTQNAAGMCSDVPVGTLLEKWNQALVKQDKCKCNATSNGCTGAGTTTNFAIVTGDAFTVITGATFNWTIVGSHDNSAAITLNTAVAGVTDGTNYVSVPYHTNKANAAGLAAEFPVGTFLQRWNPALVKFDKCKVNATQNGCTGAGTSTNFSVTIGEGLVILVGGSTPWTPAHY